MIEVTNLSFQYKKKIILQDISFKIKKGSFVSLIGKNGSGKTTLIKLLTGLNFAPGEIKIGETVLTKNNAHELRNKIGIILESPLDLFVYDKVIDELLASGNSETEIYKLAERLSIKNLLNEKISKLTYFEKHIVILAIALARNPEILIIDKSFEGLTLKESESILKLIHEYSKEHKITVLNVTHYPEDLLYSDTVLAIDDCKLIFKGKLPKLFDNENILLKCGLTPPFMISLSRKLSYYNLIDKDISTMEEMVDLLWK